MDKVNQLYSIVFKKYIDSSNIKPFGVDYYISFSENKFKERVIRTIIDRNIVLVVSSSLIRYLIKKKPISVRIVRNIEIDENISLSYKEYLDSTETSPKSFENPILKGTRFFGSEQTLDNFVEEYKSAIEPFLLNIGNKYIELKNLQIENFENNIKETNKDIIDYSCIGFKEKLLKYLQIEKELELLNIDYKSKYITFSEYLKTYNFLKEKRYTIDVNLEKYILENNPSIKDIEAEINSKRLVYEKLEDELNPGNFRNVIWCLTREAGITLEQLADKLKCPRNTFNILCRNGVIDKENYIKVCDYFKLDANYHKFIKYCATL